MCLTQKGTVMNISDDKKTVIVVVNGNKKEVRLEGSARVGDTVTIFQNLAFK